MSRRFRVAVPLLLAATALAVAGRWWWHARPPARAAAALPVAPPIRAIPPDSVIEGPVVEQQSVGDYRIRIVADTASHERVVDITREGRRVFARRSADFRIERAGQDLTGDGQPDIFLIEFTGGLHCCTRGDVLELGRTFHDYGTIDGADGDVTLDDVDHDGIPEIKVGDFRFAYWRDVPFSDTPVPDVILKLHGDHYEVACDLMRQPPPGAASLREAARNLARGWTTGDPPVDLWGYAVDLVYSGNAADAWRLLDIAWPRDNPGRADFLSDLKQQLLGSPCYTPESEHPAS